MLGIGYYSVWLITKMKTNVLCSLILCNPYANIISINVGCMRSHLFSIAVNLDS